MSRVLLAASLLALIPGCNPETDETGSVEEPESSSLMLYPSVGGINTDMEVQIRSERSYLRFGETDLDLGPGITVHSVTVHDGYTATAAITIDPDAELGWRDGVVGVEGIDDTLYEAFNVVADSIQIRPSNGKMGELVEVDILGQNTEWEAGYTWTSFGDGIDVLDFDVISATTASATIAIRADTAPGTRDVAMENGPHVTTLYDGFTVDRAVITAFFDPEEALQGDTVEFTITGLDTNFIQGTGVEFWDDGGPNADIRVTELTVLDSENMYGKMRLSNAARVGMRDVLIRAGDEWLLVPDAFEVIDAPPDLANVAIGLGFDVIRSIDNSTGALGERVSALAYFIIPLDPPCGAAPPPGSGPAPYDANGVFPVPPEAEEVDCPHPETVSAGDYVWFESDENVVTLHKDVIQSTNQIVYRGIDLTLDDYRFGNFYDLHTQGDPDGIPEVILEGVQPTVPADYYILEPQLWGDYVHDRSTTFDYKWSPAQTYPDAVFVTQISGTLEATGDGGFAGSVPWDDGVHSYVPGELLQLQSGPVSFLASSMIEGPLFGFPFSTIQTNQSNSVLQTSASLILE